ncbi:hypothetical protein CKO25_03165 [Thiocapsa imhoffii]|uniref:Sulfotransferase n=1 Tax=Thiocapsa imhoffii TaxID=382777 RepID=A0A9X0WFR8_9GAMM|nr:hypothetical protein [Thiocapsa imhoffii]MBK1643675.1 hypothetical protein [Thiocapsa imhoffii]
MRNHIILTSGRSGSNYLTNVLNRHPRLVNYGEVLAPMIPPYKWFLKCKLCPWSVERYLNGFYHSRLVFHAGQVYSARAHRKAKKPVHHKRYRDVVSIGTKDFFLSVKNAGMTDYYVARPEISIIYLRRDNLLKRYLSGVFMRKTRIAASEQAVEVPKGRVDLEHLDRSLMIMAAEVAHEQAVMAALTRHPVMSIRYEDYFASDVSIIDYNQRVFAFLGVEPIPIKSEQKKILPQAIRDLVENYDELCAHLADGPYAKFLEDA